MKINNSLIVFLLLLCLPLVACSEEADTSPTAIIIDDATGKPVEGAIALAQWFSSGGGALFGGGVENLDKAAEAFSDKDGKIFIKDYWKTHGKGCSLTVYKPGYVLWNSRWLCPTMEHRTDFDENYRTVKLLNFDTEAPKWIETYPNRDGGKPCIMHYSFYGSCVDSELGNIKYKGITFRNAFNHYVLPCFLKDGKEQHLTK